MMDDPAEALGTCRMEQMTPTPGDTPLAVDQDRIRGLEEQAAFLREQLRLEQQRNAELLNELKAGTLRSPAQERRGP